MSEGIAPRVRDFLLAHVDSIELLEVLMMLAAQPATSFTPEQVSDHLRTATSSARMRLQRLLDHQLVEKTDGDAFRLRRDGELLETLRQVADAYRDWRVTVVTLIYSRPTNAVLVFTDAFVLKKGPKGG